MIRLPNPDNYDDPIRYFRDTHKLISGIVDRFERLISKVKTEGMSVLVAQKEEWLELLSFFVHVAPIHEKDEEHSLFPVMAVKVPHTGFLAPGTPNRFMHEEHALMQERSKALLSMWKSFMLQQTHSPEEQARFVEISEALVKLYREHIGRENALIYTAANDELLSPTERIAIMLLIKEHHSNQNITPMIEFADQPYGVLEEETVEENGASDAISEQELPSSEEEEYEEE